MPGLYYMTHSGSAYRAHCRDGWMTVLRRDVDNQHPVGLVIVLFLTVLICGLFQFFQTSRPASDFNGPGGNFEGEHFFGLNLLRR